ncbi:MBL fold metallo-hydrolase [Oceanobacillus salinisoli]|uniref:MBL fold metallo-hydrolase n=1 Tax=Oceanobacillus salinisoli TaxID=2678611 RepID=UPI001E2AC021|nr:MBL fold metallo-hydrolase [Oceanobacillus salinisoli]
MVTKPGKLGRTVYLFLVDGMLIDTGPALLLEELVSFYKQNLFELVTMTHSHEDHTGTAWWIKENRNVPIYIHPNGKRICENPASYPEYRKITWGVRKPFKVLPLKTSIYSSNVRWEVLFTPGHANDHVSLYDKHSGRLFAGDLFLTQEPKIIMKDESIPLMMDSIRTLLKLDFESLFCSHNGFVPNGRNLLTQKLSYLEELYDKIEHLYRKGYSIEEIKKLTFPKKYRLIEFSKGEYDTLHAVTSIVQDIKKRS